MRNIFFLTLAAMALPLAGTSAFAQDFNGDGYADLAIGVPGESAGDLASSGAVNVLYGGAGGLGSAGNQIWDENSPNVPGVAVRSGYFGRTLASGDFNRDGYDDLAIGALYDEVSGVTRAGAVIVLFGSPAGLTASLCQLWTQDSTGILDQAEADDLFGAALGAGDFNGDGYCDLVIGAPGEDKGVADAGAVNLLYGSASGLSELNDQFWHQNSPGVLEDAEVGDSFGSTLVCSDFNGDGYDDFAAAAPRESLGDSNFCGCVQVFFGSASGVTAAGNQFWSQDSDGVLEQSEMREEFGSVLACGDFNHDGCSDLAIGTPFEVVGGAAGGGAVSVLYGSAAGLSAAGNQLWSQASSGIQGDAEEDDQFGAALASGDFNGDGFADLAIGVPAEDVNGQLDAGAVNVIYGGAGGLSPFGNMLWHQDSRGIAGVAEQGDLFGLALSAGDFGNTGFDTLVVGAPYEGVGSYGYAGAVHLILGSNVGLTSTGNRLLTQDSPGIVDSVEIFDLFGSSF